MLCYQTHLVDDLPQLSAVGKYVLSGRVFVELEELISEKRERKKRGNYKSVSVTIENVCFINVTQRFQKHRSSYPSFAKHHDSIFPWK